LDSGSDSGFRNSLLKIPVPVPVFGTVYSSDSGSGQNSNSGPTLMTILQK
jgi:hypothetical protein